METKNRYSYPQLLVVRSAKAPGQYSIGTGGQYSLGANTAVGKRDMSAPGYRVYYAVSGKTVIVILTAGDKRSQTRDITQAKRYWQEYLQHHGKN